MASGSLQRAASGVGQETMRRAGRWDEWACVNASTLGDQGGVVLRMAKWMRLQDTARLQAATVVCDVAESQKARRQFFSGQVSAEPGAAKGVGRHLRQWAKVERQPR